MQATCSKTLQLSLLLATVLGVRVVAGFQPPEGSVTPPLRNRRRILRSGTIEDASVSTVSDLHDSSKDYRRKSKRGYGATHQSSPLSAPSSSSSPPRVSTETSAATIDEKDRREMEWLVRTTAAFLTRNTTSATSGNSSTAFLSRGQVARMRRLMVAWANRAGKSSESNAPIVVESILRRFQEERDAGNSMIILDTGDYNTALDAWSRSNDERAPERAEAILVEMERQCFHEGKTEVHPDESSYHACIKAFVKQGGRQVDTDVVSRAQSVLERMLARSPVSQKRPSHVISSLNRRSYNLFLYALANSSRRDAAEQADLMLETIFEDYKRRTTNGEDSCCPPNINTFNQVLTCWARGRAKNFEDRMDARFQQLLSLPVDMKVTPTTDTYNTVMGGWLKSTRSDSLERILAVFDIMERRYPDNSPHCDGSDDVVRRIGTRNAARPNRITINTVVTAFAKSGRKGSIEQAMALRTSLEEKYDIKPDTVSNNMLVDIWCKSRRADAPRRVLELLDSMEFDFKHGKEHLKPDAFTYSSVIDCFVKHETIKAPEKAEQVLDRMKELHRFHGGDPPTANVINAVLNCWACSAGENAVKRCEELLRDMETDGPTPNLISYNTVLKALGRSHSRGDDRHAKRAEVILDVLENSSDAALYPDAYSYTAVISAFGRSFVANKASKAHELIERMVRAYENGNLRAKPSISAFNAALNACAFVSSDDSACKLEAFDILISIMELLRKYTKPNHTTYGTVLRACSSLLPTSDSRRELIVGSIFRQASQEGLVGTLVLTQLWFAASPKLYHELLHLEHPVRVSLSDLPVEWTSGVQEKVKVRPAKPFNKRKRKSTVNLRRQNSRRTTLSPYEEK